jgi:hypothetical protein
LHAGVERTVGTCRFSERASASRRRPGRTVFVPNEHERLFDERRFSAAQKGPEIVCIASPRSELALGALPWIESGVHEPQGEVAR